MVELKEIFRSSHTEAKLFFTLLRLKGMEIYFGRERASILAKRLGLRRLPGDEEIRPGAFLYAVALIEGACEL